MSFWVEEMGYGLVISESFQIAYRVLIGETVCPVAAICLIEYFK